MHELGVLCQTVKTVKSVAAKNGIKLIKYITLEVGEASGFVPAFLDKLFPVAADGLELLRGARLKILTVPGRGLVIKEIAY